LQSDALPGSHLQVLKMLAEADKRTKVSATKMNKFSNRAHRIFTIIAKFKRYDTPVQSCLTFIDLAGSEDISKSGAKGLTAREASHINKSLLTLGSLWPGPDFDRGSLAISCAIIAAFLGTRLGGMLMTCCLWRLAHSVFRPGHQRPGLQ